MYDAPQKIWQVRTNLSECVYRGSTVRRFVAQILCSSKDMLPKRRFWKDEQEIKSGFRRKHFSMEHVPNRGLTPLKSASKIISFLFRLPKSSFGWGKRRFGKAEPTFQNAVSKDFSTIRGTNQALTPLKSLSKTHYEKVGSAFPNRRLGRVKLNLPPKQMPHAPKSPSQEMHSEHRGEKKVALSGLGRKRHENRRLENSIRTKAMFWVVKNTRKYDCLDHSNLFGGINMPKCLLSLLSIVLIYVFIRVFYPRPLFSLCLGLKFTPPKRRFWKEEQKTKCGFSKHFSMDLGPN